MQIIHKKQTYFEKKGGERIDKNGNKRFSGQAVGASGNECRVFLTSSSVLSMISVGMISI